MIPATRALVALVACVALLPLTATAAPNPAAPAGKPKPAAKANAKAPANVDALLAGLSKAPGLYAHFREEKHITLLQAPLVSEGSIYFAPPSRFARHTEKPIKSVMIIDGNQLSMEHRPTSRSPEPTSSSSTPRVASSLARAATARAACPRPPAPRSPRSPRPGRPATVVTRHRPRPR